ARSSTWSTSVATRCCSKPRSRGGRDSSRPDPPSVRPRADRSPELDGLPPRRYVRGESERLHARLERRLGAGIAVDEEHRLREAGVAGSLALREVGDPRLELVLVGVRGEPADRANAAAHVAWLPVELHPLRAGLQVGAERALALIADEEQGRRRIVDEVAQVMEHAPPG